MSDGKKLAAGGLVAALLLTLVLVARKAPPAEGEPDVDFASVTWD